MTQKQKAFLIFLVLITLFLVFFTQEKSSVPEPMVDTAATTTPQVDTMNITIFVQNKEIARVSDCGATKKVSYVIPKTTAVADASLKILFENELAQYGQYDSVVIENTIAQVKLKNHIQSLSSCELAHLTSTIKDTLTQYPTITDIELSGPQGKFEF